MEIIRPKRLSSGAKDMKHRERRKRLALVCCVLNIMESFEQIISSDWELIPAVVQIVQKRRLLLRAVYRSTYLSIFSHCFVEEWELILANGIHVVRNALFHQTFVQGTQMTATLAALMQFWNLQESCRIIL